MFSKWFVIEGQDLWDEDYLKPKFVSLYFYNDNILDRCLTQNARRSGRARVPDEAIINMCASFTIPKKSEGFKYVVNVLEDDIYKRYC